MELFTVSQNVETPLAPRSGAWIETWLFKGESQLLSAAEGPADYIAIGPVFASLSKQVPDPVVGLEGVRAARAMTATPLVAIGGISRTNCSAVIEAEADSVAVISDLVPSPGHSTAKLVEEFYTTLTL